MEPIEPCLLYDKEFIKDVYGDDIEKYEDGFEQPKYQEEEFHFKNYRKVYWDFKFFTLNHLFTVFRSNGQKCNVSSIHYISQMLNFFKNLDFNRLYLKMKKI